MGNWTATTYSEREVRKTGLLLEWNTRRMMRLPEFLAKLSRADKDLLLEGYQEQIAAQAVT